MSAKVCGLIWEVGPSDRMQRFVLLAIGDNASDDGFAYPGIALLAKKCLFTARYIMEAIQRLEAEGWVIVERRAHDHKGNEYHIDVEKLETLKDELRSREKSSRELQRNSQVNSVPKSGEIYDNPPHPLLGVTVIEPSIEPSARLDDFVSSWNRLRGKLPKVDQLSDGRKKKLQARVRAGLTLDRFCEAVENCRVKPFLQGENDRGWVATFDWLIANAENIEKAINNPYGLNRIGGTTNGRVEQNKDAARIVVERIAARARAANNAEASGDDQFSSGSGQPGLFGDHGGEVIEGKR